MTILSLILFIAAYLFVTVRAINPYYFAGLIFAVPFIIFGLITYFTATGGINTILSTILTIIMILLLGILMFFTLIFISLDAATTVTTDINKYEKVLKSMGYPYNPLVEYFPKEIPDNGENIVFSYHPAILQGGEEIILKYETDSDTIRNYIEKLSKEAIWIGKHLEIEDGEYGIFSGQFRALGYRRELPDDYNIYLIHSRPYKPNNWNHGEVSFVAINSETNSIIFFVGDW